MIANKASFSIYNASAGSGKTYTLSKEYIKILLKSPSNEAYRKILAITFTNKAVEEMKSRIIFYLLEFSKDETSEKASDLLKDLVKETSLSVATIKDKSKLIIKSIIHNYTAFDISTIDRFTLKIIKSFSHELNIPQDFDISLETDLLMQEAIETVISKAGDDEELTKLLLDFSRNKTDDDKNWDITYDLLTASSLLTNEDSKHALKDYDNFTIEDFKKKKKTPLIIVMDDIRSLHNIGSVFRTADAFLVEKIYLCGITATPPNKEIQKTALGATETVAWEHNKSVIDVIKNLQTENVTVLAIEQVEQAYLLDEFKLDVTKKYALVFGNEVYGVSQEAVALCDGCIEIPQLGTKHSLNIAVSAGIVIWDLFKQLKA